MRKTIPVILVLAAVLAAGCSHGYRVQKRSNVVGYLYPDESAPSKPNPGAAYLQLPLRIGIAFVPANPSTRGPATLQSLFPPDAEKRLLDLVTKSFEGRDWVGHIQVIPTSYLVPGGGFENLQQVTRLMNVDVVALVSVDQLQTSDPRRISFLYLSIVGAYVLPLDKNETRTLIDAAVFHVPSRTFLLRAPGVSSLTGSSTAVDVPQVLRERSLKGFEVAMQDLTKNLDREVTDFKTSIAEGRRQDVDVYTAKGESVRSGGAFGAAEAAVALALAGFLAVRRRRR
ncbi:MAG: rhombotarget lipoprotein [Thermoanaerobaculia bacterium]